MCTQMQDPHRMTIDDLHATHAALVSLIDMAYRYKSEIDTEISRVERETVGEDATARALSAYITTFKDMKRETMSAPD